MPEVLDAMPASRRNRSPEIAALLNRIETQIIPEEKRSGLHRDDERDRVAWHPRGGISWLARKLGIKKQAISRWRRVPVDRVPVISKLTGIPRYKIRPDKPDIFPHESVGAPLSRRQRKVRAG